jgi:hypothetical protein
MVDDGFLIGFEDANGNFVEVGRFNNTADDVTQPLEIKHQNSGERITLDGSGLKTQKIDDDRLYAGAFPGSDADARLSNAISTAKDGDVIYLESKEYVSDRTINKELTIQGTGIRKNGTNVQTPTTWTFNSHVHISRIAFKTTDMIININAANSVIKDLLFFSGCSINIDQSFARVTSINGAKITLTSNSQSCIIDGSVGTTVTDNGSGNIIGDIA